MGTERGSRGGPAIIPVPQGAAWLSAEPTIVSPGKVMKRSAELRKQRVWCNTFFEIFAHPHFKPSFAPTANLRQRPGNTWAKRHPSAELIPCVYNCDFNCRQMRRSNPRRADDRFSPLPTPRRQRFRDRTNSEAFTASSGWGIRAGCISRIRRNTPAQS